MEKGKEGKKKYLERRQFRGLCERKERRRRWEKLEEEVRNIRTEA